MEKVRVGVMGIGRGSSMISFCRIAGNATLTAICDRWEEGLRRKQEELGDDSISYYTSFDEFLKHDMDVVVLANYATEHAPFAIRALRAGKHVISEVMPCQNLKEAVELIEAVEETGRLYCYAENYCFMGAPAEIRRLVGEGRLGEIEFAQGEYIHNCEDGWAGVTGGNPKHWRNTMSAFFYCTHSIGPLIHASGLRPVRVTGFELPFNGRMERMGSLGGAAGVESITMENGAVFQSVHGVGLSRNSVWFSMYGSKGRVESAREDTQQEAMSRVYVSLDEEDSTVLAGEPRTYCPERPGREEAEKLGHEGSDYYTMWNCMEKIRGNPEAEAIDVYEAMDMFLPGLFAYFSVLEGGRPMDVPDLRRASVRERFREDTRCTDERAAGSQLLPSFSGGNADIPEETYARLRRKWEREQNRGREECTD